MADTENQHDKLMGSDSESIPLLSESHGTVPIIPSSSTVSNQTDHKMTTKKLCVVGSILMTELCERMTFDSVMANMLLFCTSQLKYSSYEASIVTYIFGGTVSLFSVIGGCISDAFAGKYKTILGSGLVYLCGLILLPASAIDYPKWFRSEHDLHIKGRECLFFLGLTFIAIGTGGIKANVGPFGAQQVDDLGPEAVQSFFNWFYWFINAGSVIAFSAVAYVQQEKGFDVGFLIPLVSMLISIIIFVSARKKYVHQPPQGSVVLKSIRVCCNACNGCKDPSWAHAMEKHDEDFVFGVRATTHVLPIFLLIIVYWTVFGQMDSSLFLQSERMNLYVGKAKMPAALLNVFDTVIILILIPIMDRCLYPCLAKFGKSPTHLQRMGIGMVFAACAMMYAGLIEIVRKDDIQKHGGFSQELAGTWFNASNISMFAQVPEFVLIGSSEVFASISGLEFAYTQAPSYMQGLLMGLFLMMSGLGSYLASAIVGIVSTWRTSDASDWYPKEPNKGHLEYFLFLLAVLMIINLFVFILVAKRYKYNSQTYEKIIAVPDVEGSGDDENAVIIEVRDADAGYDDSGYENIAVVENDDDDENVVLGVDNDNTGDGGDDENDDKNVVLDVDNDNTGDGGDDENDDKNVVLDVDNDNTGDGGDDENDDKNDGVDKSNGHDKKDD